MMPAAPAIEKAFGAKDYSKLVPVKQRDSLGREITVWKLPEEARQANLFSGEDAGAGNEPGKRGYLDHVDENTQKHLVEPLLEAVSQVNPELAGRMQHKYDNYRFDRDTRELDIKSDYEMAWYMKKMAAEPDHKAEWQAEYNQKTDTMIRKINNRKAAMLKAKKGMQVTYYGKPAVLADFSRRGFPVLRTQEGDVKAFWEELA